MARDSWEDASPLVCYTLAAGMRTLKDSVGRLKVKIVEAADLLASDPNGKSDPFCVVKLGDMQEQKTEVIAATLNPKWNCKVGVAHQSHSHDCIPSSTHSHDSSGPILKSS